MDKTGLVSRVNDGYATIIVIREGACGTDCSTCKGCESIDTFINIKNKIDAKVGEFVKIENNDKNGLYVTFILYIIPFLMFVLGMIVSGVYFYHTNNDNYELYMFVFGVIFFLLSKYILGFLDKTVSNKLIEDIKISKLIIDNN